MATGRFAGGIGMGTAWQQGLGQDHARTRAYAHACAVVIALALGCGGCASSVNTDVESAAEVVDRTDFSREPVRRIAPVPGTRPAQASEPTGTGLFAVHVDDTDHLGEYWIELPSAGSPGMRSLALPSVSAAEEARLGAPYAAPRVTYPDGTYENPVTVCIQALGDYTRFRATGDRRFLAHACAAADWLVRNQSADGAWQYGFAFNSLKPGWVSGMSQGQGISLLVRMHAETGDARYLRAARLAYTFMMKPVGQGGTLGAYADGQPIEEEYPGEPKYPHVLNGAIFAAWGVHDLALATGDSSVTADWERLAASLGKHLGDYDTGSWSRYALAPEGTNPPLDPEYQRVHIAQCRAMYALTGNTAWREAANTWQADLVDWCRGK